MRTKDGFYQCQHSGCNHHPKGAKVSSLLNHLISQHGVENGWVKPEDIFPAHLKLSNIPKKQTIDNWLTKAIPN